jgi:hypothetical protein
MAKKKRKIFRTPEERAAWEARHQERMRELRFYMDRIKAELAEKGQLANLPPSSFPEI